ncbi:DSBA oxidoreductase [Aspergillus steynii IBT 23096]|uniref:DSBA oxidoreductase n=1 Tax=Aspergillus steynii IBT 23096 TaxID=1392250 RepID=A0A2I2FXT3_9EURO|nr:DSBA oxidoreductase [Aspergillus steynii IBT 23096]PLB45396.1 DSBA oxidoreductase [Aspergillus steynii IBT 23096]
MTNINIQIISDTVCPWCYVGFRRLSRAIATHKTTHPADTFTLTWHAFYLNPNGTIYPGIDKTEFYQNKFGVDRAAAIFQRMSAVGDAEGIAFRYGGRTGNTRDSHRLLWYAGQREKQQAAPAQSDVVGGLQTRVVERLFRAYFEEEKNITEREVLLEAAATAGLDRAEVENFLASEAGGREVDEEAFRAQRRLVTGVPYFTIQGEYAIEGANEPDAFLEAFDRVKANA